MASKHAMPFLAIFLPHFIQALLPIIPRKPLCSPIVSNLAVSSSIGDLYCWPRKTSQVDITHFLQASRLASRERMYLSALSASIP
jgi:hypothetical protein